MTALLPGSLRLLAAALLLAGCGREAPAPGAPPADLPQAEEFARHVLDVVATYPTDGSHPYHWPKEGPWRGNARTLTYEGDVLAEGDPAGRCHCCGLTFEVFLQAWQRWAEAAGRSGRILDLDLAGVRRLQTEWFGSPADRSCLHTAIVRNGLGRRIEGWEEARAGDFVQLWRWNGSGHSVVFLDWVRLDGEITGITYWSTQGATRGIARHREAFGDDGSAVKRDELWICRVGR